MNDIDIHVGLKGLKAFEKRLLEFEPKVVQAQIEALKQVAQDAVNEIRSGIPSNWQLRNNVIGVIRVYNGGTRLFLSVGYGGSGARDVETLSDNNPIKYGRWQEYGWEPRKWAAEKKGRSFEGSRGSGATLAKYFVGRDKQKSRKKEIRKKANDAVNQAFADMVRKIMDGTESRTFDPLNTDLDTIADVRNQFRNMEPIVIR